MYRRKVLQSYIAVFNMINSLQKTYILTVQMILVFGKYCIKIKFVAGNITGQIVHIQQVMKYCAPYVAYHIILSRHNKQTCTDTIAFLIPYSHHYMFSQEMYKLLVQLLLPLVSIPLELFVLTVTRRWTLKYLPKLV